MTTPPPEFLTDSLAPLVAPMYESLDTAAEIAAGHFVDFDMHSAEYRPCEAHLARAHARRLLKKKQTLGEMDPWKVAAPQPNVQVCLSNNMLRLLLLRPDRLQVPKPGTSQSRIAYFSNHHVQIFGIEASQLIGLWAPDETGEVRIQIVRTIGEVKYGKRAKVDIQFWLPRDVDDISKLEFRPSDNEMTVELPYETPTVNEEGETGDGSS